MPTRVISFDCYGTLVDWEAGILTYFRELASSHGQAVPDAAILSAYSEIEPRPQSGPYRSYREILREVAREFAARYGFSITRAEADTLPESLCAWQSFPDTVEALERLKSRFQLAIVSNIDNDLFAHTARLLEVPFDFVITAEQVRSYKPALPHFDELLRRTGLPLGEHLHAAESLFHDIAPARQLGLPNVWVKRSHDNASTASQKAAVQPDWTVRTLEDLASQLH